jgi:hypothetical protein
MVFTVLSSRFLEEESFSYFYEVLSFSIIIATVYRFGADITIKRNYSFDKEKDNFDLLSKALLVGIGVPAIVFVFALMLFKFNIVSAFFGLLVFFQYAVISLYALTSRLKGEIYHSLTREASIIYIPLILLLPVLVGAGDMDVYMVSCTLVMLLMLVWHKLHDANLSVLIKVGKNSVPTLERLYEGGLSISSTALVWMMIYYFSVGESPKVSILTFQMVLILGVWRSIELNWSYRQLINHLKPGCNFLSRSIILLKTRVLHAVLIPILVYFLGTWLFKFDLDKNMFILLSIIEIVSYASSPFIAILQRSTTDMLNTNKALVYSATPLIVFLLFNANILYIYIALSITSLVRIWIIYRCIIKNV